MVCDTYLHKPSVEPLFKVASPRPPRQWAVLQVADAKITSKGQSMEHSCDVEKLKFQVVARQFFVQRIRGVKAIFKSKAIEKASNFDQKY